MRMVLVSQIDQGGEMRGLITTLNKQRAMFVPVSAPIVYIKQAEFKPAALGEMTSKQRGLRDLYGRCWRRRATKATHASSRRNGRRFERARASADQLVDVATLALPELAARGCASFGCSPVSSSGAFGEKRRGSAL